MSLYAPSGQINCTVVSGSSYTGLHAADGSFNIVLNGSSSYVGLYHPCGAYNAVAGTSNTNYYNINGSVNVISNGSGGYNLALPSYGTPPALATSWNAADMSTGITLTNSSLTATSGNTNPKGVRATKPHTSGKWYMEFATGATWGGTATAVGISLQSVDLTTVTAGNTPNSYLAFVSAGTFFNNTGVPGIGIVSAGDIVCMACDLDNKMMWLRKNAGNWNNTAGANPTTNVSGNDISTVFPGTGAYPTFVSNGSGSSVTANFTGTFAQAVPSGFTAWG